MWRKSSKNAVKRSEVKYSDPITFRTYIEHMKFAAYMVFFVYYILSYSFGSILYHCMYGCMFIGFSLLTYLLTYLLHGAESFLIS